MTRLAPFALAAALLAASASAVAAAKPKDAHAPPSSFAPRPHSDRHVYGSPIGPPIVGQAQPLRHRAAPTTRSTARTRPHESRDRAARPSAPAPDPHPT
jgi:hypothetical protein